MNKQALTTIEIEALAPPLTAPDERREAASQDRGASPSKPETRRRAALRWFIDTLALAPRRAMFLALPEQEGRSCTGRSPRRLQVGPFS